MKNPTILVTEATGHTGRKIVEVLLEKSLTLRARVRTDDDRAAQLHPYLFQHLIEFSVNGNPMDCALGGGIRMNASTLRI